MLELEDPPTEVVGRVVRQGIEPDEHLEQQRRAAEEPDVQSGQLAEHGRLQVTRHRNDDADDDADDLRQDGDLQRVPGSFPEDVAEDVLADRAEVEVGKQRQGVGRGCHSGIE